MSDTRTREEIIQQGVEFVRRHKRRYGDCKTTGISCTVVPELLRTQDGMYAAVSDAYCSSCPYRINGEPRAGSYNPISFRSRISEKTKRK